MDEKPDGAAAEPVPRPDPIDLLMASPAQSSTSLGLVLTPTVSEGGDRPLLDLTPSSASQPLKVLPTSELLEGFQTPDLRRLRSVVDNKHLNLRSPTKP